MIIDKISKRQILDQSMYGLFSGFMRHTIIVKCVTIDKNVYEWTFSREQSSNLRKLEFETIARGR